MLSYLRVAASIAAVLVWSAACAEAADRVNLVYVNDWPPPGGQMSVDQLNTLGSSDFTHVVFAYVNICEPGASGFCPPVDRLELKLNGQPVYGPGGATVGSLQNAVRLLGRSKDVYFSFGGAEHPRTWDYLARADDETVEKVALRLLTFMDNYGFAGIDLDIWKPVTGLTDGYVRLLSSLLRHFPELDFSSSPYSNALVGAGDPASIKWQRCAMEGIGAEPIWFNRKYYGDAFTADIPRTAGDDLAPFACAMPDGSSHQLRVAAEKLVPVLATGDGTLPPSLATCTTTGATPFYEPCATVASTIVSDYAGVPGAAVWRHMNIKYLEEYAREIGVAIGGTP
ncbi:MAG: glycosyl hydrolase family 18 protein [Rhodobacter sp.]|nr:glycosyl hydrolase family 18 protein [Rhodobacter sp.]